MLSLPDKRELLEQLENALRHLICLRKHCLCGLDQDVVLGVFHHFRLSLAR